MTVIGCLFCGANMNLPLKFCLSCGRPVSSQDVKRFGGLKNIMKAGITKRLDETPNSSHFDLARKSYTLRRSLRSFAATLFYILLLVSLYYFSFRFILKQALPGNVDLVIRDWIVGTPPKEKQPQQSTPGTSTSTNQPAEVKKPEAASAKKERPRRQPKSRTKKHD